MNSEFQSLPPETQEAVKRTMDTMEPAQTPAEIRETLEGTQKGGVKNSIRNCLTVFQRDPLFRGALRLNLLTEQIDIVKPLGWERTSTTLTDMDMNYLLLYLEENYGLTSEKKVQSAIKIVANENRYHPVRDYLNSLQWDGTERIRYALHHFLGADTDEYTYEALKLFLMGAIRRVFRPGSKFEVMLCLVGGQGAGKSTFFRLLAGRDEWFSDDLKKLDDENVYRKLQGHWIIEMSEMIATANAKSIEEIKSFLSRQKETYKVPYETHPADRLRQCVFGGTTNRQDFLPRDRTGNRRFLPVTVYPERAEVHILDDEAAARAYIEQMWAEAMTVYRSGKYKLSPPTSSAAANPGECAWSSCGGARARRATTATTGAPANGFSSPAHPKSLSTTPTSTAAGSCATFGDAIGSAPTAPSSASTTVPTATAATPSR